MKWRRRLKRRRRPLTLKLRDERRTHQQFEPHDSCKNNDTESDAGLKPTSEAVWLHSFIQLVTLTHCYYTSDDQQIALCRIALIGQSLITVSIYTLLL